MLLSMTGFSSHTAVKALKKGGEKASITVEIKSLNSRFFELICKLPSSLSFLEIPITNHLKQKLVRGRVFLSIKVGGSGEVFERVAPVPKIVKDYLDSAKTLKKKFKISGDLSISDVVALDNVFSFEREKVGKNFETFALKTVEQATDKLIATRKSEGTRLQKDLKQRIDSCGKHIETIKKIFTVFMTNKKDEIKDLMLLVDKGDVGAAQSLGEAYEFLNKIDVHEEIVRFKSHLNGAKKIFASKSLEKGKRFEFTLQELSREINTIAAKCSHFDISAVAVDVKVELEKVREQVQNIV
jgi:uncharacterized protein (TIGR00255 family)